MITLKTFLKVISLYFQRSFCENDHSEDLFINYFLNYKIFFKSEKYHSKMITLKNDHSLKIIFYLFVKYLKK